MNHGEMVKWYWSGESRSTGRKICPTATSSAINLTLVGLGLTLGLRARWGGDEDGHRQWFRTDPTICGTNTVLPRLVSLWTFAKHVYVILISNFRRVVCFLLGDPPAAGIYMPAFRNTLSVPKRRHINFRHRGITQKKAYNMYTKLRGLSPRANYTDRAAAAGRRS